MSCAKRLKREWRYLAGLTRTLARVRSIKPASKHLICDDLEAAVDRWRTRPALDFQGAALTYGELDSLANRCAHWAFGEGLRRGDTVAVILPNRLEYLPLWYGLTKVGVAAALINNQLAGPALAHCLNIAGAGHCIVDAQTGGALEGARALIDRPMRAWTLSDPRGDQAGFAKALEGLSGERPDSSARAGLTAKDTALYIYTSGTTGLPKAARVTHMRAQLFMRGFAGATGAKATDRLYLTLPLYHSTGGLCAMGAALLNGGSVALRSGFTASRFWDEVVAEGATLFVYIGELCRYLAAQPPHPLELLPERDLRRAGGVSERALQRRAQVAEGRLHLQSAALLGLGVEQLLARERQRHAEQALHDALVDLTCQVDALLQLAALLVIGRDLPGDGGHRDRLAERPQQVALIVAHLREAGLAL